MAGGGSGSPLANPRAAHAIDSAGVLTHTSLVHQLAERRREGARHSTRPGRRRRDRHAAPTARGLLLGCPLWANRFSSLRDRSARPLAPVWALARPLPRVGPASPTHSPPYDTHRTRSASLNADSLRCTVGLLTSTAPNSPRGSPALRRLAVQHARARTLIAIERRAPRLLIAHHFGSLVDADRGVQWHAIGRNRPRRRREEFANRRRSESPRSYTRCRT